jgi:uncharacterized protein
MLANETNELRAPFPIGIIRMHSYIGIASLPTDSPVMKKFVLLAIRFYQRTLSPDHGYGRWLSRTAGCRFHPSCSQYTYEAVEKRGVLKGLFLGAWRILRCNPWSRGGYDPVK